MKVIKSLVLPEVCLLQRREGEEKYLCSCIRLDIECIKEKKKSVKSRRELLNISEFQN